MRPFKCSRGVGLHLSSSALWSVISDKPGGFHRHSRRAMCCFKHSLTHIHFTKLLSEELSKIFALLWVIVPLLTLAPLHWKSMSIPFFIASPPFPSAPTPSPLCSFYILFLSPAVIDLFIFVSCPFVVSQKLPVHCKNKFCCSSSTVTSFQQQSLPSHSGCLLVGIFMYNRRWRKHILLFLKHVNFVSIKSQDVGCSPVLHTH